VCIWCSLILYFCVLFVCVFLFIFSQFRVLSFQSFISCVHVYVYGQMQVIADILPINFEFNLIVKPNMYFFTFKMNLHSFFYMETVGQTYGPTPSQISSVLIGQDLRTTVFAVCINKCTRYFSFGSKCD